MYADTLSYIDGDNSQIGLEIHSGRNRVVRRMFEALGYKVKKLDRVLFAGLTKKNLRRGQWRFLTEQEITSLKMGIFE
jgi:23S rRNA pseudouridine2605 synthase